MNLDTAVNIDYLKAIEKDVIMEMNRVRTNPTQYAELYIKPRLQYYNGNQYCVPGQVIVMTQEGAAAVQECITALSKAGSVGLLTPEKGLFLAARDHARDQGRTGATGHDGSDGSTPEIRIKRHGVFSGNSALGENIIYGETTARDIICGLLIDDGVPSRGHRTNLLNGIFTQTGVSYGTHTQFRTTCAITYASGYTSNKDS